MVSEITDEIIKTTVEKALIDALDETKNLGMCVENNSWYVKMLFNKNVVDKYEEVKIDEYTLKVLKEITFEGNIVKNISNKNENINNDNHSNDFLLEL